MHQEYMSRNDFKEFARFIYKEAGIHLNEAKKSLVEARIKKRLSHLHMHNYSEYRDYLFSKEGQLHELQHFINSLTTNKTDFFRESGHFDFLTGTVLPELLAKRYDLRFWSAACSRGHEPYTLAMVLEQFRQQSAQNRMNYSILATDIDTEVLKTAKTAIYKEDEIAPIPMAYKQKFLLRGTNDQLKRYRIAPELRQKISFQQMNLTQPFHFKTPLDVIFLRNVIIYFDRETQHRLIMRMINALADDGYLMMGHSEVLDLREFPLTGVAPAVYRKRK